MNTQVSTLIMRSPNSDSPARDAAIDQTNQTQRWLIYMNRWRNIENEKANIEESILKLQTLDGDKLEISTTLKSLLIFKVKLNE
jgi:hypothetical protein